MAPEIALCQHRLTTSSEFLVFLIISGLLAIFFLLYLNRLFASIVSYAIRTWTWHRYHVYIDIQALQISLLGGRVFFTGLRYHGANETFLIQHGDITWRYWLRRVREASVLNDDTPDGVSASGRRKNASLPCRISAQLVGVEWFVYNRSPAYDSVLAGLKDGDTAKSSSNDVSEEKNRADQKPRKRNIRGLEQLEEILPPLRGTKLGTGNGTFKGEKPGSQDGSNSLNDEPRSPASDSQDGIEPAVRDLPFMLQLFPIRVECKTAAAVVGNENTKGILIVKANSLTCDVDAAAAASTSDPYRQLFDVQFDHPVIEMKDNEDYKEDQTVRATREHDVSTQIESLPRKAFFRHRRRKVMHTLRNMVPYWRRSVESFSADSRGELGTAASHVPGSNQWQGLSRYLEDRDQDDKARWASVEYAAETIILDSPAAHLTVFWDSVGKVSQQGHCGSSDSLVHVNGGDAPAWGMHLIVNGGVVNYGPWADRHRADLQRVFVPGLAKNAMSAKPLAVGSWRVATQFTFLIELEEAVTIRVPIREESKNWRWRGKEPPMDQQGPRSKRKQRNRGKKRSQGEINQTRPSGWLEFKVPADSTAQYSMDMLARSASYSNSLHVDLPGSELWSSVNHDVLWRSGAQKIKCDLSNPLTWNTLRNWHFNILSDDLKLYLLRDHIFLLIDLVNDWSSGPPSEYLVFTPYNYHLHLKLRNFQAFLNTNDGNIIDNATSLDENSYLILSSPSLTTETTIPLDKYCPDKNVIPFDIRAETVNIAVHAPQWSTDAAFLASKNLGHAEGLGISGSYQYNAGTSPANTDTLILNLNGQSPRIYLYGFLIRYLILLKDNYFGDHVHFRTLDEYQEQLQPNAQTSNGDPAIRPAPNKKSNDLDVMLSVKVDDPQVLLPTNVYSASRYIQGEFASLAVDLRFTNYYMDLELDLSPLSLSLGAAGEQTDSPSLSTSNTQLFIDGIRVFGHRTFGLPPSEPTYLCNWDASVGDIKGGCSAEFLSALTKGGAAFGFTFDDVENALVPYSSLIFHDITFVRAHVQSVSLWIHVADAAFLLSTDSINVSSNDWARSHYSKRANINIPNVQLSCIDAESVVKHGTTRNDHAATDGYLKMDVQVGSIGRKVNFSEERKTQQELVRREDQRTDRTPFFILDEYLDEFIPEPIDAPAQCAPPPPYPLGIDVDDEASIDSRASRNSRSLSRQRSFLSFSSSGESVRRYTPSAHSHSQSTGRRHTRPHGLTPLTKTTSHQGSSSTSHYHSYDHPAVTFSSPYFSPRFPMDGVSPNPKDAAALDLGDGTWDDPFRHPAAQLSDVNTSGLSEEYGYASSMIEFPSGITAVLNPNAVRHVTALLDILRPSNPEDILDNLQVEAITGIFSAKKREHASGDVKDVLVRLPRANIRFLNSSTLDSPDNSKEEVDQYDLSISSVGLVTRTVSDRDGLSTVPSRSRTSMQLQMGGVKLSAAERQASLMQAQAAVKVHIDDVMVSLGAKDITYLDAEIGSVVGSTVSDNIEYLAALIHRTGNIASELTHLLTEASNHHTNRIRYCCCRLLEMGRATNDPSFLIRPSATLRSVNQHLRTFDSWKMMMRLRQIWTVMHQEDRLELSQSCAGTPPRLFSKAADQAVEAFQQWRSWDLDSPSTAVLLKKIFGNVGSSKSTSDDSPPFLGACRLREMKFSLDPGPKENTISVIDVNTRFERKADDSIAAMLKVEGAEDMLSTVNLSCGEISIDLNWQLCDLAGIILELYNRNPPSFSRESNDAEDTLSATEKPGKRTAVHLFLDVAKGSLNLESINLHGTNLLQGLKSSALIYKAESGLAFNSLLMNCDAVTSKAFSHSQLLWTFQLLYPSISSSQELCESLDEAFNTIKGVASSRGLSFEANQDIMGLLEVADLLVRDEGAQLLRLRAQLPKSTKPEQPTKITERLSKLKLNIVMFLDGYSISIPLLQSLTYKVSGVVARAACAANLGTELIFDFDVKENSHDIQMLINNQLRSISVLEMPPTNGRITSSMKDSEHFVSVLSSVEVIRLDASSIYSLLSALNRSQIAAEVQEIQDQVGTIRQHITEMLGNSSPDPPREDAIAKPSSELVYDVRFTLGGFQALTKTSLKSEGSSYAQLLFTLDKFHMQASNRDADSGATFKYPELHLNLDKIGFDVRRGTINDSRSCGSLAASVTVSAGSRRGEDGKNEWTFSFMSDDLNINLSPETVSTVVDILGYMGTRIKDLDTSRELDYLRKLRQSKPRISINDDVAISEDADILDSVLSSVVYRFQLRNIRACWDVAKDADHDSEDKEDLHFSIKLIEFGTRTKKSARLTLESLQLQMVSPGHDRESRSHHSALLPEVTFNVGYISSADARRLAFQAVGKSLDLRLTSGFILPAANLVRSISLSTKNVQQASTQWMTDNSGGKQENETPAPKQRGTVFGNKRFESVLIDADFAGAVVHVSGRRKAEDGRNRPSLSGKYGQFSADDSGSSAVLRSPGLAMKAEYRDDGENDPSLHGEVKVDASSNILYPAVVPLVLDIVSNIKEVVSDDPEDGKQQETPQPPKLRPEKSGDEDNILTADPSHVLGRLRLNLGLRICRQEFALSCQPIARVAATTSFDHFYFTVNTIISQEQGNFFAISGILHKPQASVQHVYSRESTANFALDTVTLSFMNSKHVSGVSGLSAILNVSPMKVSVNARQLQDFMLFREIWYPEELRRVNSAPVAKLSTETSQAHLVQRYQQVAATAAFPWTATISIAALDVSVDMGQSIGKSVFQINEFWISSKKTSDWEQNLCLGFKKIGIDCTGRLSGFIALQDFAMRTSIQWPKRVEALNETPLVQASLAFKALQIKAAFDYQAFLVADVRSLEFVMYNVRENGLGTGDRLVAIFDGDAIQMFGTTTSAAQGVAVYQALKKLMQESKESFETSLKEIEKFIKRKPNLGRGGSQQQRAAPKLPENDTMSKSPISLDTDVVVTLRALNLGLFPSTFSDHQVFKMEALNAHARFAASMEQRRIHSVLRMTLGQLRIGLAGVRNVEAPRTLSEMLVEDVVERSTGSRGGTILKVPRVEAVMETWQSPNNNHIDYKFKSAFEGKVEVGWNYSRISYIRGMWANHGKSLEEVWGRQLPLTAVKITGVPEVDGERKEGEEQRKITAEVNVPQSKYDYTALEEPIIETPQLRDMGEATPPLEWIGLHRDRLPNLTHQIVIVTLLELAGEVEDAYSRILGSS